MDVLETLDSLQSAAEEDIKKKQEKSHNTEYHFDKLKMYFGEDYTTNGIYKTSNGKTSVVNYGVRR